MDSIFLISLGILADLKPISSNGTARSLAQRYFSGSSERCPNKD
jgi:hypothetical protein